MLEIILVGIMCLVGMARRPQRRRRSNANFAGLPFENSLSLGTLALDTVLLGDLIGTNFARDFYAVSADITVLMKGGTATEGPFHVGITHTDFSVTEILEYLDLVWVDPANIIERERASRGRRIKKVGSFFQLEAEEILNHGVPLRVKLGWWVNSGKDIALYAVNRGAGVTSGRVLHFNGTVYGRWAHG